MFKAIDGWTSEFILDGESVGGTLGVLRDDPRLKWHLEQIGGVKGKKVLELGPLEGAHTKMLIDAGAESVLAIEGNKDCFLRCLIVKEAFSLTKAKFLFGDFCEYIAECKEKFDVISCAGVLYHQRNPVQLIYDLAKITDTVLVWSQVAGKGKPSDVDSVIPFNDKIYSGKINSYGAATSATNYCGGLNKEAVWLYPEEMLRCFKNAGFINIIEGESQPNINGDTILFVANK